MFDYATVYAAHMVVTVEEGYALTADAAFLVGQDQVDAVLNPDGTWGIDYIFEATAEKAPETEEPGTDTPETQPGESEPADTPETQPGEGGIHRHG